MQTSDIRKALSVYAPRFESMGFYITKGVLPPNIIHVQQDLFRTGFHMIGLCIAGTLRIRVNFKEYTVLSNTFMSVPPNTPAQLISKSDDFKVKMLLFDNAFLLRQTNSVTQIDTINFFNLRETEAFQLNDIQKQLVMPLFDIIRVKSESEDAYKDDIIRHLIFALLYQCIGFYENKTPRLSTRKNEIRIQFSQLVNKHCKEHRAVRFYANKLFITPKHLAESIKEETGKTAREIIDEAIVTEAKLLLNDKTKSIQSIAEALHFNGQSAFAKFFKRNTSLSPKAWQKGL